MRTFLVLAVFALVCGIGVPHSVLAQGIPSLDAGFHIVPDAHDLDPLCPVGAPLSMGAVMNIVQSAVGIAIAFGVLIFVAIMAWAGLLFVMSATNPENRSTARKMLLNGAIGLVITLTAWLMVDFVMKTLYSGPDGTKGKFGPWNSILGNGPVCIIGRPNLALFTGEITAGQLVTISGFDESGNPVAPGTTGTFDGHFTYQGGIEAQKADMSPRLATLLTCMASHVPQGVGQISSISDSRITSGSKTFQQCAAGGCAHGANSCHYGGRSCVGKSYAVDFGDGDPQHPTNLATLRAAATACNADWMTDNESGVRTHLHVSVGGSCGCN